MERFTEDITPRFQLPLTSKIEIERVEAPSENYTARRLRIAGLAGGAMKHIGEQRANAIKLLFRFLRLTRLDIEITHISGGESRDEIPLEAYADILINIEELETLAEQVSNFESLVRSEYTAVESGVRVTLEEAEYPQWIIEESVASAIVWAVAAAADGVYRRSYSDPNRVVTASNIGVVRCDDEACYVQVALCSTTQGGITELADTLASIFELAAGDVWVDDGE